MGYDAIFVYLIFRNLFVSSFSWSMAVGKLLTATPDKLGWSMSSIGVVITAKSFSAQKNSYLPCAQTTISDVRKKNGPQWRAR